MAPISGSPSCVTGRKQAWLEKIRDDASIGEMRSQRALNVLIALSLGTTRPGSAGREASLEIADTFVLPSARGKNTGLELFRRSQAGPTRLVLTEAAQAALPDLQTGFDHLSAAMNRLKVARARRSLTLTVPPTVDDKWLLARVERFSARHPDCELRIDPNGRLADFAVEGINVGIRYGAGQWPGLATTFLARDEFFPVRSPALLNGAHPLRTAADLQHHPLIHDKSMASEPLFPAWRIG